MLIAQPQQDPHPVLHLSCCYPFDQTNIDKAWQFNRKFQHRPGKKTIPPFNQFKKLLHSPNRRHLFEKSCYCRHHLKVCEIHSWHHIARWQFAVFSTAKAKVKLGEGLRLVKPLLLPGDNHGSRTWPVKETIASWRDTYHFPWWERGLVHAGKR